MADTVTVNYSFVLPEIGGAGGTWGVSLNGNFASMDTLIKGLSDGKMAKAANLSDVASVATARTNLGLGGAATLNVGTAAGTVAAGDDSRVVGAAQKANNLSDLGSAATARSNLGLGAMATKSSVADADVSGAISVAHGGTGATSAAAARSNLGLGALSTLAVITDAEFSGTLSVGKGGTGATSLASLKANLSLGNVENKSSATIRSELTQANLDSAAGSRTARVASGSAANSGRISWGTAAPGALAEGEIYLRHA